jgi:hypothetical protein
MRIFIPRRLAFPQNSPRTCAPVIETLFVAALFASTVLAAQTPATPQASAPTHKAAHHRAAAHASKAHSKAPLAQAAPPPPPAPDWPVNDKPAPASITWDSQGLRIQAANASLQQILRDVATATGVRVEGMGPDQRVFGAFGPGKARDVLSQLLQGTGYNVLMIGDQGQGVPRQIVLSSRRNGSAAEVANSGSLNNNDDDAAENEVDEQPPIQSQPVLPVMRPGFSPGDPVRTPQQILQEQQQQQLQQQSPPSPDNRPPQ